MLKQIYTAPICQACGLIILITEGPIGPPPFEPNMTYRPRC